MRQCWIDTETRSKLPLKQTGSIRYAEDCRTIIVTWAFNDNDDVHEWSLEDPTPPELEAVLHDPEVLFYAHNSQFDRTVLATDLFMGTDALRDPARWVCTASLARYLGLPGGLKDAVVRAGLPVPFHKLDDSNGLNLFTGKGAVIHEPGDMPEQWRGFRHYARGDTLACKHLFKKQRDLLDGDPATYWMDHERYVFQMDQRINDRGFYVDRAVLVSAGKMIDALKPVYEQQMLDATGGVVGKVASPKLKDWVNEQLGWDGEGEPPIPNLQKATISATLNWENLPHHIEQVLLIRQKGAKNSIAKYASMAMMISPEDDRVRGGFLYHGAHTGRWSGQACQPQNLPRPLEGYEPTEIADTIKAAAGDYSVLSEAYGGAEPFELLMSGVRGAICAPPGRKLVIADYSQIESRILAWYAGCDALLDAYARGDDVYQVVADDVLGPGSDRQQGKTLMLGLGFGMGHKKFAAINKLDEEQAKVWVDTWREQYGEIVTFWNQLGRLFIQAIPASSEALEVRHTNVRDWLSRDGGSWLYGVADENPTDQRDPVQVIEAWNRTLTNLDALPAFTDRMQDLGVRVEQDAHKAIILYLPSGKPVFYRDARAITWGEANGEDSSGGISYNTFEFRPAHGKPLHPWGGFLTENLVQATAREVLVHHMLQLDAEGYEIVAHAHDELIIEVDADDAEDALQRILGCMSSPPPWLTGCPIDAVGGIRQRYTKL